MKKVYIISERSKSDKQSSTFHGAFSSLNKAKAALAKYLNDESLMADIKINEYEHGYSLTTKNGTNIDIFETEIDKTY